MRIIGGKHKGLRLQPPRNLPVRPTTDMAKEALFNVLHNELDFNSLTVLDLFSGTGSISLELASREVEKVIAVERDWHCCRFIKETKSRLGLDNLEVIKSDVFSYLRRSKERFGFVFADPPFDLPDLVNLPQLILESDILAEDALVVVEFPSGLVFPDLDDVFDIRKYGNASFAYFRFN